MIGRRAKGWETGDSDGLFQETCNRLREYVQLHSRLPEMTGHEVGSSSWNLAKWLGHVRAGNIRIGPNKVETLQGVHPLVNAEVQKWQTAPRLRLAQWERKFNQLCRFVSATGRLPNSRGERELEKSSYRWLQIQCRKLLAGILPEDMAQRLRNAHPLIATHVDASA